MIKCAYPNVAAEMDRNFITVKLIAYKAGYSESSVYKMLSGRTRITLETAVAIKSAIGSTMPLEELFLKEEA